MVVQHLIGPATFPTLSNQVSILTYNVLLPNSQDGWWNYKMYQIPLTDDTIHLSSWDYRRNLLEQRIATVDADVVCLQEVSPVSFADDFAFMHNLGYDHCEMHKRGRFRPATFWKQQRVRLLSPPVHKDRTLLTAFCLPDSSDDKHKHWYVLNCHLQAGPHGARRVRQINEGVRAVMTLAKKLKDPSSPDDIALIVCGDMNGGAECGAIRYLEDGYVDETWREDGQAVTSSRKELPIRPHLIDVAAAAVRTRDPPPPTLVVRELISLLIAQDNASELPDDLAPTIVESLTRIFDRYAAPIMSETDDKGGRRHVMNVQAVEKWLVAINQQVGRGSEFREAARHMGWTEPRIARGESGGGSGGGHENETNAAKPRVELPPDGSLTLEGFLAIYRAELRQGKYWGIAYDLETLGEGLPDVGLFQSRFDRIYCSRAVEPTVVMDFLCDKACPNDVEPSDHLPVAASFAASMK